MLKCGFAQNEITPPDNLYSYLDGYGFRLNPASGIHDPLYVKACVFDDGNNKFVIVSFDICGMDKKLYNIIMSHIKRITGYDSDFIVLCSIHTHAGPACGVLAELPFNHDYWNYTGQLAAQTILQAFSNLSAGTFRCGYSDLILDSAYNRRGREIIDRRIQVAAFFNDNNDLKGVISSASCHPVIWTAMTYSADYPSVLSKIALNTWGADITVMFLLSRAADIDPFFNDDLSPDERISKLGGELACAVISKTKELQKSNDVLVQNIKYAKEIINVPVKPFPQTDKLTETIKSISDTYYQKDFNLHEKHYALRELRYHEMLLDLKESNCDESLASVIQILKIQSGEGLNDILFTFLPYEVLTQTGNTIEANFINKGYRSGNVFVVGWANYVMSYLPPPEEFPFGRYEVEGANHWYMLPPYSEESEPFVINKIMELSKKLEN